mmetsp:Transcript_15475/g.35414  ORF Transcript_15475/g.35414 Transcript_15475/m.35414 type:complete len:211 (+) Transcript_15475:354-986(+)
MGRHPVCVLRFPDDRLPLPSGLRDIPAGSHRRKVRVRPEETGQADEDAAAAHAEPESVDGRLQRRGRNGRGDVAYEEEAAGGMLPSLPRRARDHFLQPRRELHSIFEGGGRGEEAARAERDVHLLQDWLLPQQLLQPDIHPQHALRGQQQGRRKLRQRGRLRPVSRPSVRQAERSRATDWKRGSVLQLRRDSCVREKEVAENDIGPVPRG